SGVLHCAARTDRNAGQRVFGNGDRQAGRIAKKFVEFPDQRAATGQHYALVYDVGGELGCGVLERDAHTLDNRANRLRQRLGDLSLVDRDFLRHAVDEVAALDVDCQADAVRRNARDAEILLDPLSGRFTDQEIVVAADVGYDRLVHLVTARADRGGVGETAQRKH